jgi:polar amino acid transport system substrate-binding protein
MYLSGKMKVFMSVILFGLFMLGCVPKNVTNTVIPVNGGDGVTIRRILDEKKLRVVCILSTSPFGMVNNQGKPEGFDVDIAYALGQSLGVEVEIIDSVEAANRVPYITSGKADVCIATLGATLERAQVIAFTDPYIRDGQVIVSGNDSGIKNLNDLRGKNVGLVRGGPQDLIADIYLKDSQVMRYGSVGDTFTALKQGKVEAVIEGKSISDYQVAQSEGGLKVVNDPFTTLYWAFGAAKGDQDWINYLNLFIRELNTTGKRIELYQKWFGGLLPATLTPTY